MNMTTEKIQKALQGLGLYLGEIDGINGKDTTAAIRVFQRINPPLDDDGVAGKNTLAKLFTLNKKNPTSLQLSPHFNINDFTRSQTATRLVIDNSFDFGSTIHNHLITLSHQLLEPIWEGLGSVYVSSGYRCKVLNKEVGGSGRSKHCFGTTADFVVNGYTPYEVCQWVIAQDLPYDNIIHEFGEWTHITVAVNGATPRKKQVTAYKRKVQGTKDKYETVYASGIHTMATFKAE